MYDAWESPDTGRRAVAKKRRSSRNNRSMAAALGAFALAWFLTTAGALASVDPLRRQGVVRYMGEAGFLIGMGVLVSIGAIGLARGIDGSRSDYLEHQLLSGRSRLLHRVIWGGGLVAFSALMGWSVSRLWSPLGFTAEEMFAVAALLMLALTTSVFFLLGPVERRIAVTTELLSESIAAARLAELSPGEVRILDRLGELETRIEQLDGLELASLADRPPVVSRCVNWTDWWRARPRRRGRAGR